MSTPESAIRTSEAMLASARNASSVDAPDHRRERLEAGRREEQRRRQLLHRREQHEPGARQRAPAPSSGSSIRSTRRARRAPSAARRLLELARDAATATCAVRSACAPKWTTYANTSSVSVWYSAPTRPRCAERPVDERERDREPGQREPADDDRVRDRRSAARDGAPSGTRRGSTATTATSGRHEADAGGVQRRRDEILRVCRESRPAQAPLRQPATGPVGEHGDRRRERERDEPRDEDERRQPPAPERQRERARRGSPRRDAAGRERTLRRRRRASASRPSSSAERERRRPVEQARRVDRPRQRVVAEQLDGAEVADGVEEDEERAGEDRPRAPAAGRSGANVAGPCRPSSRADSSSAPGSCAKRAATGRYTYG